MNNCTRLTRIDATGFRRPGLIMAVLLLCWIVVWGMPAIVLAEAGNDSRVDRHQSLLLAQATTDDCVVDCEDVRVICKGLCRDTSARAELQTGDDPHKPLNLCLEDCEQSYAICTDTCKKAR